MSSTTTQTARREIVAALREAGRAHSDATVVLHATIAERVGLNPTDYKTMSLLQQQGPMTAGAIGETTGLVSASVTALIDRLERRGFVRRHQDPADKRRVLVEATPDGIAAIGRFFASSPGTERALFAQFSTDELAVVCKFLQLSATRLHAAVRDIEQSQ
jgi:DNA-binding MarR family transcriptional regulator